MWAAGCDGLDLWDRSVLARWFAEHRPRYVYLVAGTVGGIMANSTRQAEFLYDNMMIHATVIEAARQSDVTKLLYLGSACVYPRLSPQPIPESALLTGPLEPTNEGYALAKIAGMRLCEFYRQQYGCNFITAMPTNLYGPNDNFDLGTSHVLPALMRKFHEAKLRGETAVEIWGSGKPRREFLHVDDLADACLFLMANHEGERHVNVGTGVDHSIGDLASMIRDVVHPDADMVFDTSKPDGMPRRLLDVTAINGLGWRAGIELRDGIASTYRWYEQAALDLDGKQPEPEIELGHDRLSDVR
ncbi:MAG: GDP-L-fucose synthase family protein [Acidimicrobiales bacterium]